MFRKLLLLAILPLMAGCDKSNSGITDTTRPPVYHKVPNLADDTLRATTYSAGAYVYDSIYTSSDELNNYIHYNGSVYRLSAYEQEGKFFSDSTGYYLCDLFDSGNNKLNPETSGPVKVTSSMRFNTVYKLWEPVQQAIEIHCAPFPADAQVYKGRK